MTATQCQRFGFAALSIALGACTSDAPAPRPEPPPVSASRTHTTLAGDTLCAIGGRYGVSADWLASTNAVPVSPSQPLAPGLELGLGGAPPASYRVRAGDTLSGIAGWSGVTVTALATHNRIANPDLLLVGTELRIPPGARTSCEPPRRIAAPAPRRRAVPPVEVVLATPSADPEEGSGRAPGSGPEVEPDLAQAAAELRGAEERYADADFDGAAREAAAVREQLTDTSGDPARELAARAAAVEALCHIGRQRRQDAVAAFRAALELDPAFELDRAYASPAVLPLLEAARTAP